jgi:hypothetical protein
VQLLVHIYFSLLALIFNFKFPKMIFRNGEANNIVLYSGEL